MSSDESRAFSSWLMKAEPETRMEKGVDVKFGVEDFAACGVTEWDGVRNPQASKFMRVDMRVNDKVSERAGRGE